MTEHSSGFVAIIACFFLVLAFTTPCMAQNVQPGTDSTMTLRATGSFEVKLTPQILDEKTGNSTISRMSIDKQFHGDLEATSKGQMLAVGTGAKGSSGGYVALEQVIGILHGRKGSFALQHSGTMTRGVPNLSITVVPGSGADDLVGLSGKMTITVSDGKHFYDFEYTLGASR